MRVTGALVATVAAAVAAMSLAPGAAWASGNSLSFVEAQARMDLDFADYTAVSPDNRSVYVTSGSGHVVSFESVIAASVIHIAV